MGQRVAPGYVAGKGPAVVVIQEWWGLVPHIEDVCERFAAEGFLAAAPDLYRGKATESPDEAGRMLMELDVERAERDIAAAGEIALKRGECTSKTYGVVGFCMGGALAQFAATRQPKVSAAVSFYGGFKRVKPEWENLSAPLLLIYAENDRGVPVQEGLALEKRLTEMGKKVQLLRSPNAGHAFFNDTSRNYHSAHAADAWRETLAFFRQHIR
jgi:carboxymethylenebutenolidase